MPTVRFAVAVPLLMCWVALAACETTPAPAPVAAANKWQLVFEEQPGAFLSVWGTANDDVWIVGAHNPAKFDNNPTALHWTGKDWQRIAAQAPGADFWWVAGLPKGDVWIGGTLGTIAHWNRADGTTTIEKTPTKDTIFGILPVTATDIWAVGGDANCSAPACGVIWHSDGKTWLPADVPAALLTLSRQWFKAWKYKNSIYVVGSWSDDTKPSAILKYDGKTWTSVASDVTRTLLTIAGNDAADAPACAAVGGSNEGVITQMQADGTWKKYSSTKKLPMLNGVFVPTKGNAVAVGAGGSLYERKAGVWTLNTELPDVSADDFHSVWVSPQGEVWAVGGQILSTPQIAGMVVRFGSGLISTKLP
ncbi:MAG: hypothetical protein EXR77_19385 [Myxococcales bacterium]|nr:hypothetical protein [Myxococcales bacterium]